MVSHASDSIWSNLEPQFPHSVNVVVHSPPRRANSSSVIVISLINFHHPISIKLDDKNFLPWCQQAIVTICHRLHKYIGSSSPIPPKFPNVEDEVNSVLSKEFQARKQQDQMLLTWLLASIGDLVLTRVVGCSFSCQVWEQGQQYFGSQTKAKVQQFKAELRSTTRGSRLVNEYLLRIKALVSSQ